MSLRSFRRNILQYYRRHGRDLPWRGTTNPYFILLAETMLQQTQVERVIDYYARWTKKWPSVQKLAKASRIAVLSAWSGLGYNRRAVHLHQAAQKIAAEYHGDVLTAMEDYKNIPGIGPYTAAAVRIFAANENIVTVDTNIRRILLHEFKLPEKTPEKQLWLLAERCLPKGRSRTWHNALMDYGATYLTAKKTGIKAKTTQKTFEGSDRQLRGKILKALLGRSKTRPQLLQQLKTDDTPRLRRILAALAKDDMIERKGRTYRIRR